MFGEGHHDSIVQHGLDEAFTCQDVLERAPTMPSLLTRVISRIALAIHSIVPPDPARKRRGIPTAP
jgi:hypothetical protein